MDPCVHALSAAGDTHHHIIAWRACATSCHGLTDSVCAPRVGNSNPTGTGCADQQRRHSTDEQRCHVSAHSHCHEARHVGHAPRGKACGRHVTGGTHTHVSHASVGACAWKGHLREWCAWPVRATLAQLVRIRIEYMAVWRSRFEHAPSSAATRRRPVRPHMNPAPSATDTPRAPTPSSLQDHATRERGRSNIVLFTSLRALCVSK